MTHVVFIAPLFLETTNRYVEGFCNIEDITFSVISQDPASSIPRALRSRVTGHYRVSDPLDPEQLLVATRALGKGIGKVDRLVGVLEQLQIPMAHVRDELGIEGINGEVARNFRDKDRMKDVFREHGVPTAKSGLATSPEALRKFIDQVGYPVIVKPQAGLGTRGTYRITSAEDLAALEEQGVTPTQERPLQCEQFVVGAREHTCETVTVRGKPVWRSGTRYFPTPLEVLENAWMQYCVMLPREEDLPEFEKFAPINAAALDALFGRWAKTAAGTSLTHMEWFLREDGTALVNEVGARPPGVMIMPLMSIAHETDFFHDWARLMAVEEFTPKKRKWSAGAAFFRGQGRGDRIVSVEGIDKAIADAGDALVEFRTPKVGMARAAGYEGEGRATVRGATTEDVKNALISLVENVQIRYG
ncbi:MAG: ATP-grasp domain-containing protein [Labilithrix sp.]|nr:ATP-grasp domain-containing protein [Labilithrix sp.]MCW5813263.1 ATP-grasp domain-containing protein [Labilithrix sp.]